MLVSLFNEVAGLRQIKNFNNEKFAATVKPLFYLLIFFIFFLQHQVAISY